VTVRLEFKDGKGPESRPARGSRPACRPGWFSCNTGAARLIFAGMAASFMFHHATANAPQSASRPAQGNFSGAQPLLAQAPSNDFKTYDGMGLEDFLAAAEERAPERVLGVGLEYVRPDSSLKALAAMRPATVKRKRGRDSCILIDSPDTFSVATAMNEGSLQITLRFNPAADRHSEDGPAAGTRTFDASEFVSLVRRLPENPEWKGLPVKSWSATRIFLDEIPGTGIKCALFVPVDSKGRAVTALGGGRYLVYSVVLHDGCIADGSIKVLHDKGGAYSLSVAK
jgi:hypothetical protein